MKTKNKSLFIITLIIFSFFLSSCISSKVTSVSNTTYNNPSINDSSNDSKRFVPLSKANKSKDCKTIEIKEETDFLVTNIKYPSFEKYERLDKHVKNLIESPWLSFKEDAEEQWTKIAELNSFTLPPFEYYVSYKASNNKDIISIYLEIYTFNGGAHGVTQIQTVNYDKKNDKFLSVTEASGYSYEELSDICRKQLYQTLIEDQKFEIDGDTVLILDEMREEGTAPIAGNYELFFIDNDDLTIYFEPSKVAPHYYGIISCLLKIK